MITKKRDLAICTTILFSALFGGCTPMNAQLRNEYPDDTAILIGNVPYQINTTKCAQIRAIGKDGALDCYDANGVQSASATPVSDFRRNFVKSHYGYAWASAEHQAFLFQYFHGGGQEKAAADIAGGLQRMYGNYASTKSMLNAIDRSKAIDAQAAQMQANGAAAYMSGGLPAWQAHQANVVQWRLDNAQYFIDQMNK